MPHISIEMRIYVLVSKPSPPLEEIYFRIRMLGTFGWLLLEGWDPRLMVLILCTVTPMLHVSFPSHVSLPSPGAFSLFPCTFRLWRSLARKTPESSSEIGIWTTSTSNTGSNYILRGGFGVEWEIWVGGGLGHHVSSSVSAVFLMFGCTAKTQCPDGRYAVRQFRLYTIWGAGESLELQPRVP